MFRRIQLPLGGWLLLVLSFLGFSAMHTKLMKRQHVFIPLRLIVDGGSRPQKNNFQPQPICLQLPQTAPANR